MLPSVKFYSNTNGEIIKFLSKFYDKNNSYKENLTEDIKLLEWEKEYKNPIEIATILGVFSDNIEDFDITMWISLDMGYFIKITPNNADSIIRYLYERYPY